MKKRNSLYILVFGILTLIFIWLVTYLVNEYNIKSTSDKAIEEYIYSYSANNDQINQDIPWQCLMSPFFILFTYYFIPYLIFVLAFLKNKQHVISGRMQKHRMIYVSFYFIILSTFSYIFYNMIINIQILFELFEYLNMMFLGFIIYIIIYSIAYFLGKHFACALNIVFKNNC